MIELLLSLVLSVISGYNLDIAESTSDHENFRAALYSMPLDLLKIQQEDPQFKLSIPKFSTITYKYFIEYGQDTLIEILDPGVDFKSFSGYIKLFDYLNRVTLSTYIKKRERTYYIIKDSINYNIENRKGYVTKLCNDLISDCDSVQFVDDFQKKKYKVIFKDSLANLRSDFLFYPDIKYLPYEIFGIGKYNNTMTLEKVYNGKAAIDSILQLFNYSEYTQVTDIDLAPYFNQISNDILNRLKCND
jgi:hypothetical protein